MNISYAELVEMGDRDEDADEVPFAWIQATFTPTLADLQQGWKVHPGT